MPLGRNDFLWERVPLGARSTGQFLADLGAYLDNRLLSLCKSPNFYLLFIFLYSEAFWNKIHSKERKSQWSIDVFNELPVIVGLQIYYEGRATCWPIVCVFKNLIETTKGRLLNYPILSYFWSTGLWLRTWHPHSQKYIPLNTIAGYRCLSLPSGRVKTTHLTNSWMTPRPSQSKLAWHSD